jgi:hypothetical protein
MLLLLTCQSHAKGDEPDARDSLQESTETGAYTALPGDFRALSVKIALASSL